MTRIHTMVVAAALFLGACGAVRERPISVNPDDVVITEIEFDAVVIRAGVEEDGRVWSESTDLPNLFIEANDYLTADDYAEALELYDLILDVFDTDDYRRVTYYNSGLALEGLEEWEEAASRYETLIATWPSSDDATAGLYRLAECYARVGRFSDVPALMDRVLERSGLELVDRLEGHLRWANALLETRDFAEAEEHFRAVADINERARARGDDALETYDSIIAQALFGRARVYHELFLEIRLVLPQDRLTRDLIDKTQLFEQAQDTYLDTVRTGHPYWAPAAGYMVGQLYEDFYYDVLASEVPEDFNDLEIEIYFEELRAFIQPALERAMSVYEHNLAMAHRLHSDNVWVDDTLASILRVQDYLYGRETWDEEHRLVLEERHPRSAHFTDELEFRNDH